MVLGHMVFWPSGLLAIQSSGHPAIWSSDHLVIRPSGHSDFWPSDHPTIRSSDNLTIRSSGLLAFCPDASKMSLLGYFWPTNLKFLTSSLFIYRRSKMRFLSIFWRYSILLCKFQSCYTGSQPSSISLLPTTTTPTSICNPMRIAQ